MSSSTSDASLVTSKSPLEVARLSFKPRLPTVLKQQFVITQGAATTAYADQETIKRLFPRTYGQRTVHFTAKDKATANGAVVSTTTNKLRIGIVLSGGPAPGGHNVIAGVWDALPANSVVFGFLDGPDGLVAGKYRELNARIVDSYRNMGGFHMIGSGRGKMETKEQLAKALANVKKLELDGVVIVGGDDSNTNGAILAEYFLANSISTRVIGVPKTIDADLRNEYIDMSFGFDTATKSYSEQIAALAADAASSRKTYHFIRLMGRSASHITLECALQTHPNMALVGEEIMEKKQTLTDVTREICDVIQDRAKKGKHYGTLILPEGLVDSLTDVGKLLSELNDLIGEHGEIPDKLVSRLSGPSAHLYELLPKLFQSQLTSDRDPHGNVHVSRIESERLLAGLVENELAKRKSAGQYKGSMNIIPHFLGYQGRCGLPSNFDCNYCYALGLIAVKLISANCTGMIAIASNLTLPPEQWQCGGMPLTHMMNVERRHHTDKPVIRKALVELDSLPFKIFSQLRNQWKYDDHYRNPGAIQYNGAAADSVTLTLTLCKTEQENKKKNTISTKNSSKL